jgi:hypothetical protein
MLSFAAQIFHLRALLAIKVSRNTFEHPSLQQREGGRSHGDVGSDLRSAARIPRLPTASPKSIDCNGD